MKDAIITILGIFVSGTVLLSPVACTMHRQRLVAEAIKGGADPIAAKCAIEADVGYSPQCIAIAMRGPK